MYIDGKKAFIALSALFGRTEAKRIARANKQRKLDSMSTTDLILYHMRGGAVKNAAKEHQKIQGMSTTEMLIYKLRGK